MPKEVLVDSQAYVSASCQTELNQNKQQAPNFNIKTDNPPNLQKHVANGRLKKPMATVNCKINKGDNSFAEPSVILTKSAGPKIGLQFFRHNSVVIDSTQGLIHLTQVTIQVKGINSKKDANP